MRLYYSFFWLGYKMLLRRFVFLIALLCLLSTPDLSSGLSFPLELRLYICFFSILHLYHSEYVESHKELLYTLAFDFRKLIFNINAAILQLAILIFLFHFVIIFTLIPNLLASLSFSYTLYMLTLLTALLAVGQLLITFMMISSRKRRFLVYSFETLIVFLLLILQTFHCYFLSAIVVGMLSLVTYVFYLFVTQKNYFKAQQEKEL
ncbi:hypothetical protein CDO73_12465 [Saccharibacillus sp. O23]|nr:hypothetical protein CDO73_12465 [Saccharibacillus sp. O23]